MTLLTCGSKIPAARILIGMAVNSTIPDILSIYSVYCQSNPYHERVPALLYKRTIYSTNMYLKKDEYRLTVSKILQSSHKIWTFFLFLIPQHALSLFGFTFMSTMFCLANASASSFYSKYGI